VQSKKGRIIKFLVSRCQILRQKCTEFDFSWEFTPDPAGGNTALLQTIQLDLSGGLFLRGGEKEKKGEAG